MARLIAAEAVLAAVYAALNVASMIALCAGGIHNGVPASTAYPYLRTETVGAPHDTMGTAGGALLLRLHIFSQERSDLELVRIMSKARDLLEYQALSVSGYTLHGCKYEQDYDAGTENIANVETRHHIAEFRILVRQA